MDKVLQFIYSLSDGGAETLVKDYCIVSQKKHEASMVVLAVTKCPDSANTRQVQDYAIPVYYVYDKVNLPIIVYNKLTHYRRITNTLKEIIEIEKPIALHIHLELLRFVYPLSEYLREKKIRLFYTCHTLPKYLFDGTNQSESFCCQQLIRNNGLRLIALHDEMKEELNHRFGVTNTVVIRNGIDFDRYRFNETDKSEKRNELGIPQDAYVIGHVGRFSPEKNHEFIVHIFEQVKKKNRKAHLLLIGDGEQKEIIRQKINKMGLSSSVTFLSKRSDVPKLLHAMDVFLFPSSFEGLGIALIEAQTSNLPCVVSDTIPAEALNSAAITKLSLTAPLQEWVEAVLFPQANLGEWGDISKYDMNRVIYALINLYREETK